MNLKNANAAKKSITIEIDTIGLSKAENNTKKPPEIIITRSVFVCYIISTKLNCMTIFVLLDKDFSKLMPNPLKKYGT